jgi:hypothetical protein
MEQGAPPAPLVVPLEVAVCPPLPPTPPVLELAQAMGRATAARTTVRERRMGPSYLFLEREW